MALDFSRLRESVSRNTSVDGSAEALIRGIKDQIKQAIVADDLQDATTLNALVDEMDNSTAFLAKAVAENTPSAPPPTGEGEGSGTTTGESTGGE